MNQKRRPTTQALPTFKQNLRRPSTTILCAVLCLSACSSHKDPNAPPRYASSVIITSYTTTTYPPTHDLTVYNQGDKIPPHKIIAMLSRHGHERDQGKILNAIAWKARQLGAQAIILLDPREPGSEYSAVVAGGFASAKTSKEQPVWRANAIIYTDVTP